MEATIVEPDKKVGAPTFMGLKAYSEEQSHIFFGRDQEIQSLYKLINAHTLTILFGKSGTGKTSLLNAGVFPKLRKNYCLPFRIRLEFLDDSPDLLTQIKQVLKSEIDKYGFKVDAYPSTETLWEFFHREPLWRVITPILIFDQFEEIFTLAKKSLRFKKQDLDMLLEELSDLIENSIPEKIKHEFINNEDVTYNYDKQKAKIIFSFREDFLPEIESITTQIPSAKNARYRLMPMNGHQAYEVITKTWRTAIDPAEANKIVYFLTNETETESIDVESKYGKYDLIEIEPSLLSQVCSYIDKERIRENRDKISADFLKKYPKGKILRSLYDQVLQESNALNQLPEGHPDKKPRNVLKEFIEDNLITDEGYRTKFATKNLDDRIKPGIENLKRKYFIREEANLIELTHDVIVTLVKSDREERRKEMALAAERKKARKKAILIVIVAALAAPLIWYFVTQDARAENQKLETQRRNLIQENKRLDSIVAQKADSIKSNAGNLRQSRASGPITYDSLLRSMQERILYDSAHKFNLTSELITLQKKNADYSNNLKANNAFISSLEHNIDSQKRMINELKQVHANYAEKKDYARMYQSHINAFIDNYKDSAELQYRINVLKQNRDGFKKKFDLP